MRQANIQRRRCPTHPGALLREDVLPAMKVSVSKAAMEMGISRQTLHRLLNESIGVSPEMALRLGKFCGNGPGLWLRMQASYDLWQAEQRLGNEVRSIPTRGAG